MKLIIEVQENGDYTLFGDDGEARSEGSLLDLPALAIDVQHAAGIEN